MKKIFRDISRETWGDTVASSSLTMAFQNKMIDLNAKELERERLKKEKLLEFNETEKSDLFFRVFDNTCRRALFCSIRSSMTSISPLCRSRFLTILLTSLPTSSRSFGSTFVRCATPSPGRSPYEKHSRCATNKSASKASVRRGERCRQNRRKPLAT